VRPETNELLILAAVGIAIPIAALAVLGNDMSAVWGHAARSSIAAGILFAGLAGLALIGFPKKLDAAGDDDEDEGWRWNHVRLWQLCIGLGIPLLLYADGVTGDTGDFNRMQASVAF
tara:strand:+ start:2847 stop:3197 length:351 start_codon:yes stop_codon:yes gene_type:complete